MKDGLKNYSSAVDNQNTINNYASSIENIISKLNTTNCLQWQNDLQECEFRDLIQSLNCCKQKEHSSDDLNSLFNVSEKQLMFSTYSINGNKNIKKTCLGIEPPGEIVDSIPKRALGYFKSARDELEVQNVKKFCNKNGNQIQQNTYNSVPKRSLGARRGIQSKFVPPIKNDSTKNNDKDSQESWEDDEVVDERLKNIDPRMVELIRSEIMDSSAAISWDDIAGLEFAKTIIKEVVVWPLLRPDIFTGLRRPPKGDYKISLIDFCVVARSDKTM